MFEFERKIDIVALVALVLSLIAIGIQIYHYAVGATPVQTTPDGVVLGRETGPIGDEQVQVVASVGHVNDGASGTAYVVDHEYVVLQWGTRDVRLDGVHVVKTNSIGSAYDLEVIESADPFIVRAEHPNARRIRYMPRKVICDGSAPCEESRNFLTVEELLDSLPADRKVKFQFHTSTLDHGDHLVACQVEVPTEAKIGLVRNGWVFLPCLNSPATQHGTVAGHAASNGVDDSSRYADGSDLLQYAYP